MIIIIIIALNTKTKRSRLTALCGRLSSVLPQTFYSNLQKIIFIQRKFMAYIN